MDKGQHNVPCPLYRNEFRWGRQMRIAIIGAGKVGYQLVESLVKENHDILVVDTNQDVLDKINDNFDVLTKRGNGISSSLLKGLGIEGWDLFIAVTDSDEANIVARITSKTKCQNRHCQGAQSRIMPELTS